MTTVTQQLIWQHLAHLPCAFNFSEKIQRMGEASPVELLVHVGRDIGHVAPQVLEGVDGW